MELKQLEKREDILICADWIYEVAKNNPNTNIALSDFLAGKSNALVIIDNEDITGLIMYKIINDTFWIDFIHAPKQCNELKTVLITACKQAQLSKICGESPLPENIWTKFGAEQTFSKYELNIEG